MALMDLILTGNIQEIPRGEASSLTGNFLKLSNLTKNT
jgi:hypothetical protein